MSDYWLYKSKGICPRCKSRETKKETVFCEICIAEIRYNNGKRKTRFTRGDLKRFDKNKVQELPEVNSCECGGTAETKKVPRRGLCKDMYYIVCTECGKMKSIQIERSGEAYERICLQRLIELWNNRVDGIR